MQEVLLVSIAEDAALLGTGHVDLEGGAVVAVA